MLNIAKNQWVTMCLVLTLAHASFAHAQIPAQTETTHRGFAALEEFARTRDVASAAVAARAFIDALRVNKDDPWAHFGLGVTLYKANKTMALVRASGIADGEALYVAQRELEKVLDLAPGMVEAADALGQVALLTGDKSSLARARAVLTKNEAHRETVGKIDLALGDTAAVLRSASSSAPEFLRRAIVLFDQNRDSDGAIAYFRGVEAIRDESRVDYLDDLSLIAGDNERADLEKSHDQALSHMIRLFWQKRAMRDGVTVNKRIGDHYRRLAYASAHYRASLANSAAPTMAVLRNPRVGPAARMDDRGLVYVRYGKPEKLLTAIGREFKPNETWAYRKPDGSFRTFRFTTDPMSSGFRLVSDAFELLAGGAPSVGIGPGAIDPAVVDFFSDQGQIDPTYAFVAARLLGAQSARLIHNRLELNERLAEIQMERLRTAAITLNDARSAMQADEASPTFERIVPVLYQLATFRGVGCTDVIYSVAVPAPSYHLNLTVMDTLRWEASSVDSTVATGAGPNQLLRSTGVLCLRPNPAAYVRLTAAVDERTGVSGGGQLNIRNYGGTDLTASDIIVATVAEGRFIRGGVKLSIWPSRQFAENVPFKLFYELYNLKPGSQYRTDMTFTNVRPNLLSRLFRGNTTAHISFEGTASSATEQVVRTITPEVSAGEVRIHITVTDLAYGTSVSRAQTVWVLAK